jgi:hypothetical protein
MENEKKLIQKKLLVANTKRHAKKNWKKMNFKRCFCTNRKVCVLFVWKKYKF